MILKRNTFYILVFFVIGFLFCSCTFRLKGWFIVPMNKNAKQYETRYGESKNISVDKNMDIRFDLSASIINTGSYVSKSTDSIDFSLKTYIFKNQKYIPAPEVTIDEFTLIDLDKNDTLEISYIRCNYENNLHKFSEITPAFQELAREDSIRAAKESFWKQSEYPERSYELDFRTNRQLRYVKHLLLNLQFSINKKKYKIRNCKYEVKEGYRWILPH